MKKLILITGFILIGCVIISALAAPKTAEDASPASVSVTQSEDKRFVIKSEKGRLVVYRKGEEQPFMTTDTFTDTLPKGDKRQLEQGVEVTGESRLKRTLEDYCS